MSNFIFDIVNIMVNLSAMVMVAMLASAKLAKVKAEAANAAGCARK